MTDWRPSRHVHANILKRLLVHVAGFNLALLMRGRVGVGTPRGLQGRVASIVSGWRRVRVAKALQATPLATGC